MNKHMHFKVVPEFGIIGVTTLISQDANKIFI